MYIPQQDDIVIEEAHLEPEHELDFSDNDYCPETDHYRFTDTLTLH